MIILGKLSQDNIIITKIIIPRYDYPGITLYYS